jgi:PAS domain S-box-containing protein
MEIVMPPEQITPDGTSAPYPSALQDFRDILFNAPIGIFTSTPQGRFVYANPALARMYGYDSLEELLDSVDDLVRQTYAEPADRAFFVSQLEKYGEIINDECRLRRKDGSFFWVSRTARLIQNQDSNTVYYQGFTTDITDRKEAEQALQASRERLHSIFRVAPTGIGVVKQRVLVDVNRRICEMTGYHTDELIGRNARMLYPSRADYEFVGDEKYRQIAVSGTGMVETRWQRKDGKIIEVLMASTPLDPNNLAKGVTFTALDITERKQAAEALRQSEERFRSIVEGAPEPIFIQTQLRFAYLNPKAIELFGANRAEELLNTPVMEHFHPDFHDIVRRRIQILNEEQQSIDERQELQFIRLDGSTVWVETSGHPIIYQGQRGALVFVRDISQRKEAEKERDMLQQQLVQSQKMESIGRLAGGIAHDFNNMLGVILGHTEMAMEDLPPDQPLFASLMEIEKAAERSAKLTGQLLAFARKQIVAPRVIDLNDTVTGMLQMLRRLIGEQIDLLWLPGAEAKPVKMDPTQIDQILANLCVNARDAIADFGSITIETDCVLVDEFYCTAHPDAQPGDYVLLVVSDDGCGMGPETIEHLFEPFFTTKEVGAGTGLGLATVYGIVRQNGGFINIYSETGHGTTCRIYLPRHRNQQETADNDSTHDAIATGHETVLLVEDEPMILDMTRAMLQRQGYRVLAAALPGEAKKLAARESGAIDLLITDVVMPEMNGRDLAEQLRELTPGLKTLFMSGYTANVILHHGVLDGGVSFIQKPFCKKKLLSKVREVLDQDVKPPC